MTTPRPPRPTVAQLEDRTTPSVSVLFDFRFDDTGGARHVGVTRIGPAGGVYHRGATVAAGPGGGAAVGGYPYGYVR